MKDKLGRVIFCPYGVFGKCYVVPSPERSAEIARFHRWFTPLGVLATLAGMVLYGTLCGLGVCVIALAALAVKYRRWQSDMVECEPDAVPSLREVHLYAERGLGKGRVWLLLLVCVAILGCAVLLFVRGEILGGTAALAFSGVGIVTFGWRLSLLSKASRGGSA